jgi:hypothetical protein
MCCRQEELPPVWNAFRFPYRFTNSSLFLSKLGNNSYTFADYDLLAYITPASAWRLHPVVFHNECHLDSVSVDKPKVPSLLLLGIYLRGDRYTVMIMKPVSLLRC